MHPIGCTTDIISLCWSYLIWRKICYSDCFWKSFTLTLINYEVMRNHLRVNCEGPWCTNRRNWTCQLVRSVWEVTLQKRILWSFQFRSEVRAIRIRYICIWFNRLNWFNEIEWEVQHNNLLLLQHSDSIQNPRLNCNAYYAIPKSQLCLIQNLQTLILDGGALELYLMH
jgi:hypothetical protein